MTKFSEALRGSAKTGLRALVLALVAIVTLVFISGQEAAKDAEAGVPPYDFTIQDVRLVKGSAPGLRHVEVSYILENVDSNVPLEWHTSAAVRVNSSEVASHAIDVSLDSLAAQPCLFESPPCPDTQCGTWTIGIPPLSTTVDCFCAQMLVFNLCNCPLIRIRVSFAEDVSISKDDVVEVELDPDNLISERLEDNNVLSIVAGQSVGGIAADIDPGTLSLETPGSGGSSTGLRAGVVAAVAAGALALGGAAWYARRRWLR